MKTRRAVSLILALALVFSTVGPVWAAQPNVTLQHLAQYGDVATDVELEGVEGELNPILAGAIVGAVGAAFEYATSPGEKSLRGLGKAVGLGALEGAVGGGLSAVARIARGVKASVSAASVAWSAWGGANAGAVSGAVKHLSRSRHSRR